MEYILDFEKVMEYAEKLAKKENRKKKHCTVAEAPEDEVRDTKPKCKA